MPRKTREKGESGIYHIIMRGINRQTIFEDEEDCAQFLQTLQRYKKQISSLCLLFDGKSCAFVVKNWSRSIGTSDATVMWQLCILV
jgi:REP element-mobilizing transposase RayT